MKEMEDKEAIEQLVSVVEESLKGKTKEEEIDNSIKKIFPKLYFKDKYTKSTTLIWNKEKDNQFLYGNFVRPKKVVSPLKKFMNNDTHFFIIHYINDSFRFYYFKNLKLEKNLLIENEAIDKFLELVPVYVVDECLNPMIIDMTKNMLKVLELLPTDGRIKITEDNIDFISYVYS